MPRRDIVVIGASAGGVEALATLCGALPAHLAAAVLVCLHVSGPRSHLPRILAGAGPLPATHAVDGDALSSGQVLVAPPGLHLAIERGRVRLAFGAHENGARPAIDVLFRTAAAAYGARVIGVVLTGRLDDGAAGLALIKDNGGLAIVQDPATALCPDMPRAALAATAADYTVPLEEIGPLLARLTGAPHAPRAIDDGPSGVLAEVEVDASGALAPVGAVRTGSNHPTEEPAGLSCPLCNGALWRSERGNTPRYRCRVGHAFTEAGMVAGQDGAVDAALWTALRALEEQRELLGRLASRARARGSDWTAQRFITRATHAATSARVLHDLLKDKGRDGPLE